MTYLTKWIYWSFHPKAAGRTFFSTARGTLYRIDHMLDYKTSLGKSEKTEFISSIFSNHNAMRLEMNYKKTTAKNSQTHGGYTICY